LNLFESFESFWIVWTYLNLFEPTWIYFNRFESNSIILHLFQSFWIYLNLFESISIFLNLFQLIECIWSQMVPVVDEKRYIEARWASLALKKRGSLQFPISSSFCKHSANRVLNKNDKNNEYQNKGWWRLIQNDAQPICYRTKKSYFPFDMFYFVISVVSSVSMFFNVFVSFNKISFLR